MSSAIGLRDPAFDFVIIGGGTAGAVLAARLSEDPAHRVLLLEAGGSARGPLVRIPAGYLGMLANPRYSWCYQTEPVPGLGGRRLPCPRGRVLGGSSSINGMIYVRGQAEDYDDWEALGATGWNHRTLLPYFRRAIAQTRGESEHHGATGPVVVTDGTGRDVLSEAFFAAARAYGLPANPDFNGSAQEGTGYYQFNIAGGERCGTAQAYLAPARSRSNLAIETGAQVSKIVFEGRRAVGVRYACGGAERQVLARREIILTAGAVGSPQLLLASGIGPGRELQSLGLPVVRDLAAVGENLQDHLLVRGAYRVHGAASLNRLRSPLRQGAAVLRWLARRDGPLATGPCTVGAFFRTRPGLERPDAQLHFVPCSFDVIPGGQRLHRFDGMTSCAYQLRPTSRGRVRLAVASALEPPRIEPGHLSTEFDQQTLVAALKIQRAIFQQQPLTSLRGEELLPGLAVDDDAGWLAFARETGESAHHLSGSCAMGGPDSVVDPQLRVRGVQGLRVADASVMPAMVSGNTQAATIVIGERAADLLLDAHAVQEAA